MALRCYRDLVVWQKAVHLAVEIHRATSRFPHVQRYGLASQIERAATSVPANIAEGNGRSGRREYVFHLSVAHGSLLELETHLVIAQRLAYLEAADCERLRASADEVGRMLRRLMKVLRAP